MINVASLINRGIAKSICASLFLVLANSSEATILQEINYKINILSGTPTGEDIHNTLIFEWNGSERSVDYPYTIAGSGQTELTHVIPFIPTSALVIGYLDAKAGVGDEKRHLYTLIDVDYSNFLTENLLGTKFSTIFGQGEQFTINLLEAVTGTDEAASALALDQLWDFVTGSAAKAAFDPAGEFRVHKWSPTTPPVDVAEPSTLALFGFGLAGLGYMRRKA